jgi:hypothetical protein
MEVTMKKMVILLLLLVPVAVNAQLTISSSPANNSTNVPLQTTITITFSEAIDTLAGDVMTNVQNMTPQIISPDLRTITTTATLSANTTYFFAFYSFKAVSGAVLQVPYVTYFTTGVSFPTYSVTGTISSGQTTVPPAHSLVVLTSDNPLQGKEDHPTFVIGAVADASGIFTIPYVANGSYYFVAAKDVNGDGNVEPDMGIDAISNVDSLIMNNANITGKALTFQNYGPKSFSEAAHIADSISQSLPASASSLRNVQSNKIDSTGKSTGWQFAYVLNTPTDGHFVYVRTMQNMIEPIDTGWARYLLQWRTFNPLLAADASVFIANVENEGGRAFRQSLPAGGHFMSNVELGDLQYSNYGYGRYISDNSKLYWGASYIMDWWINDQVHSDSKIFIGDFSTGAIVYSSVGVQEPIGNQPASFVLNQNYPNPFNPTTMIQYTLPARSSVRLIITNLLGQEIKRIDQGVQNPGSHQMTYRANGSSGVYFYRIEAVSLDNPSQRFVDTKKMLLLK